MPVVHIQSVEHLQTALASYQGIIVKFGGTWCKPCVAMDRVISGLNTNKYILLVDIDTEDMQDFIRDVLKLKFKTIPAVYKYSSNGAFTKIECTVNDFAEKCLN